MEENKKSKLLMGILIGILLTLVIGMGAFIVYDKVLSNDSNQVENENNSVNNNYNYSEIDKLLNENLSNYINFRVTTDGINSLNTSEGRLELVNSILMELELCNWYDGEEIQSFPYVKYNIYKEKYKELFGSSNDLEQDLKKVNSFIANTCTNISSLSDNNICWNGTWGATNNDIVLKSKKVSEINDNNYKITGNYNNKFNNEIGIFEIEYVKTSSDKYLTSIELIKK